MSTMSNQHPKEWLFLEEEGRDAEKQALYAQAKRFTEQRREQYVRSADQLQALDNARNIVRDLLSEHRQQLFETMGRVQRVIARRFMRGHGNREETEALTAWLQDLAIEDEVLSNTTGKQDAYLRKDSERVLNRERIAFLKSFEVSTHQDDSPEMLTIVSYYKRPDSIGVDERPRHTVGNLRAVREFI